MLEFDLKLDDNGDIIITEDGDLELVHGDECTTQRIKNTLNTHKGEFFINEEHGTEYMGKILGNAEGIVSSSEGNLVISDAILQEPEVAMIEYVDVITDNRTAEITFEGVLESGSNITVGGVNIGE